MEAGDTIGVVTGDICVGVKDGDNLGESIGSMEADGTGTGEEVSGI